jgi:hypothetical protein
MAMKNKLFLMATAGALAIGGIVYGLSSTDSCPLQGTIFCPKTECPLAGTPDCPMEKGGQLADCCKKK